MVVTVVVLEEGAMSGERERRNGRRAAGKGGRL
jgi:hypothetical protein